MRRILGLVVVLAAAAGLFVLASGAGEQAKPQFRVELDNAFGLIEGGDFKIAGVRAGKIKKLDLDRRTKRAIVSFEIDQTGFGDLRRDARCEVAPQSLVGEYFVDCRPGTARERLPQDALIPVERTATVVPPDLVGNIQRLPYRERLRLVIGELGAAVSGNGPALNAALRRANPALRETNEVLGILARQNQVLADLVRNGDTVLEDLAGNRRDVGRFVVEAGETAAISAERDDEISAGFRRLPGFLRELRPTMAELGRTVAVQGPALQELAASAEPLEELFERIEPFAEASRPALRSLGEAAVVGRDTVPKARPTVARVEEFARGVPEVAKNLAITLEHLDDREHAVEADPNSPGGRGYTGLEAFLQYVFDQTLAINVFDSERHILKAIPFVGVCAPYADRRAAREVRDECAGALGPKQIGFEVRDETEPPGFDGDDRARPGAGGPPATGTPLDDVLAPVLRPGGTPTRRGDGDPAPAGGDGDGGEGDGERREAPRPDAGAPAPPPVRLPDLDDVLPGGGPSAPALPAPPALPAVPDAPRVPDASRVPGVTRDDGARDRAVEDLGDFLFGR